MTSKKHKKGEKKSTHHHKKAIAIAKAKNAAKTNKTDNSLVMCEVKLESGEWIQPSSCQTFYIDEDAKFPEITYEIKTEEAGPYEWSWDIRWVVKACPQASDKKRFKPKHAKTFSEKGSFTSDTKTWVVNLNDKTIGGILTVKVKGGSDTFIRKTIIKGKQPSEEKINAELDKYASTYPNEVELTKKIFHQESHYRHFYSDESPLVSFDNGYGLGQATTPEPSYEQAWNWHKHAGYIVTKVIKGKRDIAKKYLDKHGNYTDEHLDTETLVYYNGANFHYYVWDVADNNWVINPNVTCDPDQSNKGWDLKKDLNKDKTLQELKDGLGTKPVYTGRCYAEHIKNHE